MDRGSVRGCVHWSLILTWDSGCREEGKWVGVGE